MSATDVLIPRVNEALDRVVDPCSVGRMVPAGLVEMGMVKSIAVVDSDAGQTAIVTLQLTSPGCHFQMWFTDRVASEIADSIPELSGVEVVWSDDFDWTDDDMSVALKARLNAKRQRVVTSPKTG